MEMNEPFFKMKVKLTMANDSAHDHRKQNFKSFGGDIVEEKELKDGNFEVIGFISSSALGSFLSRNGVISTKDISAW